MAKTSPAQLDREIAAALLIAKSMKGSHSAKALATLAMMGTTPEQWQLTPIDWVEEERDIPGLVTCPSCHGRKFVVYEGSRVIPRPTKITDQDHSYAQGSPVYDYDQLARKQAYATGGNAGMYGNCQTCMRRKRGWLVPQGKVMGTVRATISVGYPRFPARTRFDSRYQGGGHCALCNKTILKSGRVPVHGTSSDGVTHGMFVGEDCGQKFLDVKLKRKADSIMETGNGPA
jgi:hypothetical protein